MVTCNLLLLHIVVIIDGKELLDDLTVVRSICIRKRIDMCHDFLDFFHAFSGAHPETLLRLS